MPLRRRILWIIVSLLIGLAINAAVTASRLTPSASPWPMGRLTNLSGPAAAAQPLPIPPPHTIPWPPATQWMRQGSFGRHLISTWHQNARGLTTHQIEAQFFGWPFRSLARVRLWWPWSDPDWAKNVAHAGPNTIILWPGAILNTLLFALPIWLFLPPLARRLNRRAIRLRRGQCPHCGYDLTGTPTTTCPECGCS